MSTFTNGIGWSKYSDPDSIRRIGQPAKIKIQLPRQSYGTDLDERIVRHRKCLRCQTGFTPTWRTNYVCYKCTQTNSKKDRNLA